MQENIAAFKSHVRDVSSNPDFIHHKWFVQWHLEIVERIAVELLERYPTADKDMVEVMVWLHDYGKILDFNNQYTKTLSAGTEKLLELGFSQEFTTKAIDNIATLDRKMTEAISQAPIEVQIVSSADGCSHLVGPFMQLWWYENADKPYTELMLDNKKKALKDWNRKVVLPEARTAFQARHDFLMEQSGDVPGTFL